jgi:hypothetical protein
MSDLTFGQRAVGLSFNPSDNPVVGQLKQEISDFIDTCDVLRDESTDADVKRMYAIAITEAQTAQMWAVKAATWDLEAVVNAPAEAPVDSNAITTSDATPAADVLDPAPQSPEPTVNDAPSV